MKGVNDVLPSISSASNLITSVETLELAVAYVAARERGFGVTNNSLMQFANSVGNHTLSSNLPLIALPIIVQKGHKKEESTA